jgi:hypothetical protein
VARARQSSGLGRKQTRPYADSTSDDPRQHFLAPAGPLLLEVRPGARQRVRARVNLVDVATIVAALSDGHSTFDLASSLSVGAPVFLCPRTAMPLGYDESGFTQVGTIFLAHDIPGAFRNEVLRHEGVHVLQWDAYNQLVAFTIERAIVRRLPGGSMLQRVADVGVLAPASAYLLARQIPYDQQPWEREAYLLTTGRPTFRHE